MVLPVVIVERIIQTFKLNIKALENNYGQLHNNSKTPQRVKNSEDFAFGVYLGGLKKTIVDYAQESLSRKLTPKEWDEIDNIVIDYQDKLGDLIFK